MELLLGLIRSLVFGVIVISCVEIIMPEGNFKKHYNYVSSLILLLILFGAVSSVDFKNFDRKVFTNEFKQGYIGVFNDSLYNEHSLFLEKQINEALKKDIKSYFENNYEMNVDRVYFKVKISSDMQEVVVSNVIIFLKKDTQKKEVFFREIEQIYEVEIRI